MRILCLVLCLVTVNSYAQEESIGEVTTSYSQQGDLSGFGFGIQKQTGGMVFSLDMHKLTSDKRSSSNGNLSTKLDVDSRYDFVAKMGKVVKLGKFSVVPYVGVGLSKLNEYRVKGTRATTADPFTMVEYRDANRDRYKMEAGLRLDYTFGNRDINPYVEVNHHKYTKEASRTGVAVGLSLGF